MPRAKPAFACLATSETVAKYAAMLKSLGEGIEIIGGLSEGHVQIKDGGVTVCRAIRKGDRNQPWIVGGWDHERVQWKKKEDAIED